LFSDLALYLLVSLLIVAGIVAAVINDIQLRNGMYWVSAWISACVLVARMFEHFAHFRRSRQFWAIVGLATLVHFGLIWVLFPRLSESWWVLFLLLIPEMTIVQVLLQLRLGRKVS
jgi:hypothetical protein